MFLWVGLCSFSVEMQQVAASTFREVPLILQTSYLLISSPRLNVLPVARTTFTVVLIFFNS